jgi:hypothetical protein
VTTLVEVEVVVVVAREVVVKVVVDGITDVT